MENLIDFVIIYLSGVAVCGVAIGSLITYLLVKNSLREYREMMNYKKEMTEKIYKLLEDETEKKNQSL